jgi:DNA polymerase-3 subunit gamma/tau
MSLVDQVIAFSGDKLTADDVTRVLGVADRKILHELAAVLIGGDAAGCLDVVERLARQGFDLVHVARDVLRHLRNLVVTKVCTPKTGAEGPSLREMLDLADEEVQDVVSLASRADADDLSRCFHGFSAAFDELVRSDQPRMALEMTLVRLARRPPLLPLDELLARVGDLERRLGGAPPPAPGPRGGGGGGGRGIPIASPPAVAETGAARTHGALALAEAPSTVDHAPGQHLMIVAAAAPSAPPDAAPVVGTDDWRTILERVRKVRASVASVLEHAIPLEIGPVCVRVGFDASSFLAARATECEAVDVLTLEARAHFGAPTLVTIESAPTKSSNGARPVAAIDADRRRAELAQARAAVRTHPVVEEAIRIFGAKLEDVRLPNGDG